MHVAADLNWFLQFIVVAFAGAFGLLYLVRNTASRYFVVDSSFDSSAADYSSLDRRKRENMAEAGVGAAEGFDSCAVCGLLTKKQCARCKMVKYCSEACQKSHWHSEHKTQCNELQSFYRTNHTKSASALRGRKASVVPVGGRSKIHKQANKILFPYEEFVKFFNWDKPGYHPCGLINCGNSCFANVVLQCLAYTRPLVAYLLEKGHRIECQRDDWCFLCEFQTHVERASRSIHPFSPINILSRLPNIGGNLGYGKQEDAHEFMRFSIDTMQSVCLDEFGGERAVHPSYQETTLIQHIFGGRLQSKVICAECNNVSNQFENMMDLTVEIHGDAGSLEECLDQFTAKEWLHGDNMYKCDGCNAYVMAWKRLTVQRAPNILTIALKRFQSGRFGKLNKRVTFPETLDLGPYMSEVEDGNVFKLYAVIVHVDMLNASFFGHYICYVKDFRGKWYRIDDCKVASVDLDEVLSQGAYMLLYSRIHARPSSLLPTELLSKEESENVRKNEDLSLKGHAECSSHGVCIGVPIDSGQSVSANCPGFKVNREEELSFATDIEVASEDTKLDSSDMSSPIVEDVELHNSEGLPISLKEAVSLVKHVNEPNPADTSLINRTPPQLDGHNFRPSSISDVENASCASKINVNVASSRKLTEESTVAENCTSEEGNCTRDLSTMAATAKVRDGINSANSTSMPEGIRWKNGFASDNIQGAAKKSDGESNAAKFKPIFAPGFLGKHPRKEEKVSAEVIDQRSNCHLNNHTNGVAKSRSLCENGGLDEKPENVHENGKASMLSYVSKSPENGDSQVIKM
ncbi:ubiquitin carboxyl-terminal hydrolase 18 [Sesamum indicum]|uniref:Ubiquitin carboxyl-terminal hydrolase 18 n=1 Tax=Sesamum indicum TaxID=4182 RepID=A0A6I9TBD5_SESIN|nr:ubiquitin carboxyl-terminal hydrolase 18 [Sesamum indicum]